MQTRELAHTLKHCVKTAIKKMPVVRLFLRPRSRRAFPGTLVYWEKRYAEGGNSGAGSTGRLAAFKAEFLNAFVAQNSVESIVEFGCGDGSQLLLAKYPRYIGYDVSRTAIERCTKQFAEDLTKRFELYDPQVFGKGGILLYAELAISLDVIYHLIEDDVYYAHMSHLFSSASRFVIIYSTNFDGPVTDHVKHRQFTLWVAQNASHWRLTRQLGNRYLPDITRPRETSAAGFYVYELAQ